MGRYEFFGPGGSFLVVDTMTDNVNRALVNVRTIVTRKGGKMGSVMQTLFDTHNVFGRMGELGGEIPLQLLGVVCGFWLFRFRDTSSKSRSFWWGVLFMVVTLFFACYGGGQIHSYLNNKDNTYTFHPGIWIAIPVTVAYLGLGALIAFKSKVSNPKEAVVFAFYFIILYASTWFLMNLLKFCWARPRWRHLYAQYGVDAADYFQPCSQVAVSKPRRIQPLLPWSKRWSRVLS